MKFLYPSFLYALFALIIPIVIHLFNFKRYKTVYFSNVDILEEVKTETKSTARLKNLLILLMRLLTIAFLVFAFAQPYIPTNNGLKQGNTNISVFIDNSFSMNSEGDQGQLIQVAKQKAIKIINSFEDEDKFQILTNDFEGKHQRLVNKKLALELINDIKSTPRVQSLHNIISRQKDALNLRKCINKQCFILSDFQKNNFDINSINKDSTLIVNLLPLESQNKNNLFIDTCYFLNPIHSLEIANILFVEIANSSNFNQVDVPLELFVNNEKKSSLAFSVDANSSTTIELSFIPTQKGINNGLIKISDYPISFDDNLYFNFLIKNQIEVLTISDNENDRFNIIFDSNQFNYKKYSSNAINYNQIHNQDVVILNKINNFSSGLTNGLIKHLSNNKSLIVFPDDENKEYITNINKLFTILKVDNYKEYINNKTRINYINYKDPIYKNVFEKTPEDIDLPTTSSHYTLQKNQLSSKISLLGLENNNDFLVKYNLNKGNVYVFTSSLDSSLIENHAIFLPTLYSIGLNSVFQPTLYHTIGVDKTIIIDNISADNLNLLTIKNENLGLEVIPEQKIFNSKVFLSIHNQISESNNYYLTSNNIPVSGLSFNYDRNESIMDFYSTNELKSDNFNIINTKNNNFEQVLLSSNNQIWFLCILFALLFLLTEIILIKLFKP